MILVDANVLLYAYNASFEQHETARFWLEEAISGRQPVRLAWTTILAFIRIATNPRVFEQPLTSDEATSIVGELLAHPNVDALDATPDHWTTFAQLIQTSKLRGPAVMDAHLAALALDHGATLYTTDRDFGRFVGLRLGNPLD